MTGSNSSAVRQAIRDSWAKDRRLAKVMFFSMRPKSDDLFRELRAESVKYADLVIVSHAYEGINSSADATLHMLKAAVVLGSEITHVVKMDEDCFVHIENMIDALASAPKQWMYGGNPFISGDTLEKHKPQEPGMNLTKSSWPPAAVLPAYAAGYGVAFTLDLMKHIASGAAHMTMPPTNPIWLEDAATGIWVKYIGHEQQDNDAQEAQEPEQLISSQDAKVSFQLPYHVEWGQDMCLIGEGEALGNWDVAQCIPMAWNQGDMWTAQAALPRGSSLEYKYIVREGTEDVLSRHVLEWQPCDNLRLECTEQELTVLDSWEGAQHKVFTGTEGLPQPLEGDDDQQPLAEDTAPLAMGIEDALAVAEGAVSPAAEPAAAEHLATKGAAGIPARPVMMALLDAPVLTAEELATADLDSQLMTEAPATLNGIGGKTDTVHAGAEEDLQHHISQVRRNDVSVPAWLKQQETASDPLTDGDDY
eukprot:gene1798-2132_t